MYYTHTAHFFYGLGLRTLGRDQEAAAHIARAAQILRSTGLKAILSALEDSERRLAEVLERKSKLA